MNPMIGKELRQRMRERRAWMLPSLYLGTLGGAVALAYYFAVQEKFGDYSVQHQGAEIGATVFYTVVFTQLALLLLLAPVFSAGSLTIEKEQRTLAGLLTSLLRPGEIWWGKFVSAMLFLVLLLVSALPVLSLAFALGGVGPEDVLVATGTTLLVLASMSAVGLFCSSAFRRSVHSTAVSYGVVIALTVLTVVATQLLVAHWNASQVGARYRGEPPEYVLAPMYLNPFFPLGESLLGTQSPIQHVVVSMLLFAGLGCLAAAFALRNIERGGEQL